MNALTLTGEQQRALAEGAPVRVVEPVTQMECVLIRADHYPGADQPREPAEEFEIPPAIRQAQEAFLRDLPQLLREKPEQWALYVGDRRIALAKTERELIQECLRRGLKSGEYYLGKVALYMLGDLTGEVDVDPSFFEFDEIPPAP